MRNVAVLSLGDLRLACTSESALAENRVDEKQHGPEVPLMLKSTIL